MRLSTEVAKLEEAHKDLERKLANARPPGNVVLVNREGFSKAYTINTNTCYGEVTRIYQMAEHQCDFATVCSPSDHSSLKTRDFRSTGRRDFWNREILEEI